MLEAVARHRLLSSVHLALLAGGSRQQVLRRLQLLFHHGYLDRPRAQLAWYVEGSRPFVYALGREGAMAIGAKRSRWTQKNGELGRGFLEHTLAVADFLVRMDLACRETPGVEFISEEEIRAALPRPPESRKHPFRLRVAVEVEGRRERLGVIPDTIFGLRFTDRPPSRGTHYFFLEVDRGTMPIARKSPSRTSLVRKFLTYHTAWKQGVVTRLFGFPNVRVLTVTTSRERVEHLVAACRSLFGGLRLFLFADRTGAAPRDILARPWVDASGQDAWLLPKSERHS